MNSTRPYEDDSIIRHQQWQMPEGGPHQQGPDPANPNESRNSHEAGDESEEEDGMFWATFVMVVLIGSNLVALWCERSMTPDQSLLRGLATLRTESANDDESAGREDPDGSRNEGPPGVGDNNKAKISRRRTTRIVYLRW
jgi:hypothetical protein